MRASPVLHNVPFAGKGSHGISLQKQDRFMDVDKAFLYITSGSAFIPFHARVRRPEEKHEPFSLEPTIDLLLRELHGGSL